MSAPVGDGGGRRGCLPLGVVAGLVVLLLVLLVGNEPGAKTNVPYDPASYAPSGTRALVELLRRSGARVDVPDRFPPADADVAIVFSVPFGGVDDDGEPVAGPDEELERWVRAGHTLVVADPYSDLVPTMAPVSLPPAPTGDADAAVVQGTCTLDALRRVAAVQADGLELYQVPPRAASCLGDADAAFVVSEAVGEGRVVSVGGGGTFTNEFLGDADNAVLAVDLLAPQPGTRVAVLRSDIFAGAGGAGDLSIGENLGDLVGPGARFFVLELVVATAVYGWARGRRLGRPVLEPQPVQLAGSDLVEARGRLLERRNRPHDAARRLRDAFRREVGPRLGLPADAPADLFAATIAERTGLDPARTAGVIADLPVGTDDELVTLARQIETIREEVLHGHAP